MPIVSFPSSAMWSGEMARILIAEDEPDVLTFVVRALRGAGHELSPTHISALT